MPRIRKKTSNRASTNDRAKLRHKVAEGRKKNRKLAKKNVQWKSRAPKDPGIPNNLPFKDQILAEIAAERQKAEEEKALRKSSKKTLSKASDGDTKEDDSSSEHEPTSSLGINTLSSKAVSASTKKVKAAVTPIEREEDEPLLLDPSLADLQSSLDAADIWLYVLDARDPLAHRVSRIEDMASKQKKTLVFVLNKVDLSPKESVSAWLQYIRQSTPCFPSRVASAHLPPPDDSSAKGKGKAVLSETDGLGIDGIMEYVQSIAKSSETSVAVLGLANVGKSSLINSICGHSRLPVYKTVTSSSTTPTPSSSSTTTYPQPIFYSSSTSATRIRFIDTPGLETLPPTSETDDESERSRVKDVLLRSRGRVEKMKAPEVAARWIISRADPEDLMLHYNTPAYITTEPDSFLSGHARATGRLKRGGVLDLADSARSLLRDWRVNKLPWYTHPPAASKSTTTTYITRETDETVMSALSTRKEMRASGRDIVRLTPGSIDGREVKFDAPALPPTSKQAKKAVLVEDAMDVDDDEDDEAEDTDEEEEDDDDNELSEDEDEESEDEAPPPPPMSKRKIRTNSLSEPTPAKRSKTTTPVKKVTFSNKPKPATPSTVQTETTTKLKSSLKERLVPETKVKSKKVEKKAVMAKEVKVSNSGPKSKVSADSVAGEAYDFKQFF